MPAAQPDLPPGTFRAFCLTAACALWLWIVVAAAASPSPALPVAMKNQTSCSSARSHLRHADVVRRVGSGQLALHLAPLLAMLRKTFPPNEPACSLPAGPLRGKLVEINLVMGIVKLALIVLAMVFSASPLPFQTVATQDFFLLWWMAAVLLYFARLGFLPCSARCCVPVALARPTIPIRAS